MHIIYFIITCFFAVFFLTASRHITRGWIKKSFISYGIIFMITAMSIGTIYMYKHKTALQTAATNLIHREQEAKPANIQLSQRSIKNKVQMDAPLIGQLPELPRGCEVTSLAMLLQYHDINIDKMELAKKVKRDNTAYKEANGSIYFGNPYKGFVGDMYSFQNPGLGVYHKPIAELAAAYAKDRVHDLSGQDFTAIINQLNQGRPVWVIINVTYKLLPESAFTTWETPDGPIKITKKEHSVLITGYDEDTIYFNDPLQRVDKAPIEGFKKAWIQMGKQAITVY